MTVVLKLWGAPNYTKCQLVQNVALNEEKNRIFYYAPFILFHNNLHSMFR